MVTNSLLVYKVGNTHHLVFRNKHEKLERKGEASFDTPFMMQSRAESMKKILGAL